MWPLSDKRIAEREFERLCIRVPNPMGDQIMATPALEAVRRRYPKAFICGYGPSSGMHIYDGGPWFDDFFVVGRREAARSQARKLKERRFDACLLLTGSFRTAMVPFLARVPHRIGYRWSGRTPLLTAHWRRPRPGGKKAPYPTKLYFLDLVQKIGAGGGGRVALEVTTESDALCDAWMAEQGLAQDPPPLAGMCVGASFGPSKLWPAEYFARVAEHLHEHHGMRTILFCAPGEEEIGAAVRGHARCPLIDTGLSPLRSDVLKAVLRRCRVLVTNDTGPRHIAAAFGVPIVCMMGSTDPTYTDTDLESTVVLRQEGVECAPCHLKVCPIDHRCMVWLKPDRAIQAVDRVLAG